MNSVMFGICAPIRSVASPKGCRNQADRLLRHGRLGGLDCDRKAPGRVALRAFENSDIITSCRGFGARQPHGLAALGAWKDSDLCTAEYWIGMNG